LYFVHKDFVEGIKMSRNVPWTAQSAVESASEEEKPLRKLAFVLPAGFWTPHFMTKVPLLS